MFKKHLPLTLAFLLLLAANITSAQVYTMHPKYSLQSIYSYDKPPSLWFDRIDTAINYTFTIDFDKKIINDPTDYRSPLTITDIVNAGKNDGGSTFYILKVKPNKYLKWCYYKLMINSENIPIYIQETDQQKDRDSKRDTFFHTYTSNLATLSFYQATALIKDITLNEDRNASYSGMSNLWREKWKFADHVMEMRDGYINWTEPGKKHHMLIKDVALLQKKGSDGIRLVCTEKDGESYFITYGLTDVQIEEHQSWPERHILMFKVVDNKKVWGAILR